MGARGRGGEAADWRLDQRETVRVRPAGLRIAEPALLHGSTASAMLPSNRGVEQKRDLC